MDFNKFIENYKTIVTKKYVCFEGRAGREEFWYFVLANFIVIVVLGIVGGIIRLPHLLTSLYGLAILLPSIGVTARRLHDIGKSGWLQLIVLIPIVGPIILLILCAKPGLQDGEAPAEKPAE